MEKQIKKCVYCKDYISSEEEETITEDGEPAHQRCQDTFDAHWQERNDTSDLMQEEDD